MKRAIIVGVIAAVGALTYPAAYAVAPSAHSGTAVAKSTGATHVGPDKVAWYDASRPTNAAPPAPMAGVGPKDLVVEGLTINTALLPISLPIPPIREVTAFTALSFKLPAGASPASLTLKLTGRNTAAIAKHLPSGVTPIACPTTSPFKAGLQQPTSAAPKYDCSKRSVVGQLTTTGKAVTFPGISRLQVGSTLSMVILPGSLGLEKLVFSPPTSNVLSLLSFATSPPLATSSSPPAPSVSTPPGPCACPAVELPPPPPGTTMPAVQPSAPIVAATTPALTPAALSKPNDGRERTRAIGMLLLLLVVVGWLIATERGGRAAPEEHGVGRFRSARSGPPPTI